MILDQLHTLKNPKWVRGAGPMGFEVLQSELFSDSCKMTGQISGLLCLRFTAINRKPLLPPFSVSEEI